METKETVNFYQGWDMCMEQLELMAQEWARLTWADAHCAEVLQQAIFLMRRERQRALLEYMLKDGEKVRA